MGETKGSEKNDTAAKVAKEDKHEKKEKHANGDHEKEGKGEEKAKDKKKDKGGKDKEADVGKEKKEKKEKNPEDKNDPTKLKQKLEKLDVKIQALATKREEILKMINEADKNAANQNAGGACPPASS